MGIKKIIALLPVEAILIAYLIITAIFIGIHAELLQNEVFHLLFRFLIIGLTGILMYLHKKFEFSGYLRTLRIFLPFLILGFLYSETDYLNNLIFTENLDPLFSKIEASLFGFQPSMSFSKYFSSNIFAEMMYFGYFSYYLLVIGFPVYLYCKVNSFMGEYFGGIIITSFLIYYVIFIIFPVAGPQFYFQSEVNTLPNGFVFGPVMHWIQFLGEKPTAAFPSSHISICIIIVWGSIKYATKILFIVAPIAILLIFSTVYLKAHYVIDVGAGILFAPIVLYLSHKIYKSLEKKLSNFNSCANNP